ncbi:hypothetical protein [uncultured Ferrimonas sp.]|uniref:hypothetical protein n=1 Tax=uncultured Ferrimonas sp. TaxID=432640 RepID=UPI00262B501D|nr:hypothetical protein [uncultured Ferrimonas sp.]
MMLIKRMMLIIAIVAATCSAATAAEPCDISGIWQHAAKPATLRIDLSRGEMLVYAHQTHPDSTGLVVLNRLKRTTAAASWQAQMYSAAAEGFVEVQLLATNCNQLSVRYQQQLVLELLR